MTSEKYILTVRFDEMLPMISLEAEAPDRGTAIRLITAAKGAIDDAGTSTQVGPQIQSLVVESAGPVRSKTIVNKPQPLLGVVLAILLFGIWSAGVAVIPRLVSAWRRYGGARSWLRLRTTAAIRKWVGIGLPRASSSSPE